MGITELKRKGRRNRTIASNKVNAIKQLLRKPTIKNVDIEAIKASFAENKKADSKKEKTAVKNEKVADKSEKTETKSEPADA